MSKKVMLTLDDESYETVRQAAGGDERVAAWIADSAVLAARQSTDGAPSLSRTRVEYPVPYEQLLEWARNGDPADDWSRDTSNPFEPEEPSR